MVSRHSYLRAAVLLLVTALSHAPALSAQEKPHPSQSPHIELPEAPSALSPQQAPSASASAPQKTDSPSPPNETEEQRKARIHEEADRDVKVEETQRIAVVVPNFNTVITGRAVPLSPGQKTDLALHAAFDPFNFVGAAFNTGVSELTGSHRGFGWGPAGAAKRYGANIADVVDGTLLAGAVYPIILRQDPRFFRKGTGTFGSRIRHALLASVICRGDSGRRQPNFSNVLGNFTSGLISNAYYPSQDTGIGLSLINSTIQTAEGAAGNIALEFSPDVSAYLDRRRHRAPPAAPALPTPGNSAPQPTHPDRN